MPGTLTIRDESLAGEALHEWSLEVLTETLTVRELIRSRVYQEVQDHNRRNNDVFQGIIQPEESEKTLNGWKLKKSRQLDWKKQFDRALEAFEKNQNLILINEKQADSLEDTLTIEPITLVTFLKLTPLVGG